MSELLKREETRSGESLPSSMPSVIMATRQPMTCMISEASTDHSFSGPHFTNNMDQNEPEYGGWMAGINEDEFYLNDNLMNDTAQDQQLPGITHDDPTKECQQPSLLHPVKKPDEVAVRGKVSSKQ
jgi:hypothetical protein